MAFVILSIFSFIICISCATHTTPLSSLDGQLVSSCRSRLLVTLLSFWSSLSCRSLVGRWLLLLSSLSHFLCWSLGCRSSLWFNCCSNSWLHWVSRLIAVARVCPRCWRGFWVFWLTVVIDHIWTMQLFVLEAMIRLITRFPQTSTTDDAQNCQRVDHPHVHQLGYLKNKRTKNLQGALGGC